MPNDIQCHQDNSETYPKAFAFSARDKRILRGSSSGGAFFILASRIIRLGGIVFGARLDSNGRVVHDMAETLDEIRPLMKSKYAQSKIGNTFVQCKEALQAEKWVLFSGTPCQINALHAFLDAQNIDRKQLVSADIICHGTPRSWIWEQYLREIQYVQGEEINFRYKKPSWDSFSFKVGNVVRQIDEDPYFWLFLNNYSLSESCFSCKCKGENRRSDITLGDFWGIKNIDASAYDKMGTSLIVIRRRLDFFRKCFGPSLKSVPYSLSIFENSPYYLSVNKPAKYDECYELLKSGTLDETAKILGMLPNSKHWYSGLRSRLAYKPIHPSYTRKKVWKAKRQSNEVGIISDFAYRNFGNKLQNYALKTFIEKRFGKHCVNIVFSDYPQEKETAFYLAYRLFRHPKQFVQKTPWKKRCSAIKKASKKYERNFRFHRTRPSAKWICKLDRIIFGSDQIWNYGYHSTDLAFNLGFLGIEPMPLPLYAYAASIGKEGFSDFIRPLFQEGLRHFDKISVREQSAVDLLQESFGINAQLCVDPTLLLSKQEWEEAIAKYSSREIPKCPYALLYIFEEEERRKEIKDELSKRGLKYIDLFDPNDDYYISNQFDFINLIAHASELHTNSFHGVLFSLVFCTPFICYPRQLMTSAEDRINTLLYLCGIAKTIDSNHSPTLRKDALNQNLFVQAQEASMAYLRSVVLGN